MIKINTVNTLVSRRLVARLLLKVDKAVGLASVIHGCGCHGAWDGRVSAVLLRRITKL